MRKLAFGYSTRCNIRCAHCVATGDLPAGRTMDHDKAKEIIAGMARADVGGGDNKYRILYGYEGTRDHNI